MRDLKIDNCKCLMIVLVVAGHLFETGVGGAFGAFIYKAIYTFHIPAFIFLMGIVAKPNKKKIAINALVYLGFQVAYLLFDSLVFGTPVNIYFRKPYWLLWFSLVEIYYGIFAILLQRTGINIKHAFALSLFFSLVAGYCPRIGYTLSSSRAITFLPYYLGGVMFKNSKLRENKIVWLIPIAICGVLFLSMTDGITAEMLYGSYSYELTGYNPIVKLILYIVGFTATISLYMFMPKASIPYLTNIGMNTLPIYLFHGFVIMVIKKYKPFMFNPITNLMVFSAIEIGTVFVLSRIRFHQRQS